MYGDHLSPFDVSTSVDLEIPDYLFIYTCVCVGVCVCVCVCVGGCVVCVCVCVCGWVGVCHQMV